MKILLINPKNVTWTGGTTLPLGLGYLASVLEYENHEVKCVDMQVSLSVDIEKEVKNSDVIGISACTPNIKEAWKIAKLAKDKIVLLGGPHPTAMPEESLSKESVCVVVRGEGEETIREICKSTRFEQISGISYKKNGKIIHNPERPFIKNLDNIPFPARHLFPIEKYRAKMHRRKNVGNILTTRGCPCDCNFCYKLVFGRDYRVRSAENVIEEWEQMLEMKIEEINVTDDNFTVDKERVFQICEHIIGKKLNIPWTVSAGLRPDFISKEILEIMKRSGCYRVAFGAESGSQTILDKTGKRIKLEQIRKAVELAKSVGLEVTLFFMVGNLYENRETIQETIEFAKKLNPDFVQFTIATPYPGTKMRETIKKDGVFLINDWEKYGSYEGRAYFEYKEIKKEIVESMYRKAYWQYYLRPNIILKYLMRFNFDMLKGVKLLK